MLFCRANLATSDIFFMESSSSKFRSETPLRGVEAMALGVGGVAAPGVDGFTAPGVDAFRGAWRRAVLRFVCVALSVRAHRPAAARPRAPAVLWGCFFRGRRTQLQSLQTRCHRAMRTSELSHTQDHCFKQHRALGTLPKK